MITIAHRIQLMPNNKQKTYFRKAIGCCRFAYNWGLAEWQRRYKEGERDMDEIKLRNAFNAIRKEQFPWTYEVSKYATAYAFTDLQTAFNNFFAHRTKYPKMHKKRDNAGTFYLGSDAVRLCDYNPRMKHLQGTTYNIKGKHQYMKVPNLGYVKTAERLRFNGKIMGIRISQNGDKFFATFQVQISEEEYLRTHPNAAVEKHCAVGIDFGINEVMTLSDNIAVHNPHITLKYERRIARMNRRLRKRRHARTKQERLQGVKQSNNFNKMSRRINHTQQRVANIRRNLSQKLTTVLTTTYKAIAIEDLNVKGMMHGRNIGKSIGDVGFGELRKQIEYKAALNNVSVTVADRFYPSSKTCHACGYRHSGLERHDRYFVCPKCGYDIKRDLNAALNLRGLIPNVGTDYPELTPADLTALLSRFTLNGIATSKIEAGRQRKAHKAIL